MDAKFNVFAYTIRFDISPIIVYTIQMPLTYDPVKDRANIEKHGISLARAEDLEAAVALEDDRKTYGEIRIRAFGYIDGKAYFLVFTRRGNDLRAISLRRARAKEIKRYAP